VNRQRTIALGVGLLAALFVLALLLLPGRPRPPALKHLVVITVDGIRGDRAADPEIRTPALDRLAAEGFLFDHLITASSSTGPSHATILTSQWPNQHGLPHDEWTLADSQLTLSELMYDKGFVTAGFPGSKALTREAGFAQGFQYWDQKFKDGASRRDAWDTTDAAIAWLKTLSTGDHAPPVFLFVNLTDAAIPLNPDNNHLWAYGSVRIDAAQYDFSRRGIRGKVGRNSHVDMLRQLHAAGEPTEVHDIAMHDLYKAAVSSSDHQVGRLLETLERLDLLDQSAIFVVSTHGMVFEDRPGEVAWSTGTSVLDDEMRVAMWARLPGGEGGGTVVDDMLATIDLAPTWLELFQEKPHNRFYGYGFASGFWGGIWPGRAATFVEASLPHRPPMIEHPWVNRGLPKAVRTTKAKFVVKPQKGERAQYDLAADPTERTQMDVDHRLAGAVAQWVEDAAPAASAPLE